MNDGAHLAWKVFDSDLLMVKYIKEHLNAHNDLVKSPAGSKVVKDESVSIFIFD